MFVSHTNPASYAPATQAYEVLQPVRPTYSFVLPTNLSPEEIREMVREVLG